jgi:hypothetical protein
MKLIYGEWTFARVEMNSQTINPNKVFPQIEMHGNYKNGYMFFPDNSCENKLGYFKSVNNKTVFLGTKTKYIIEDDSLKVLNLIDSTWESTKIQSITSDTLTLATKGNILIKFSKANYIIDKTLSFDKIIVSSTPCNGPCEINDISIAKNGDVVYFGQRNNTIDGLFQSKVNKHVFTEIEQNFKKADIEKLSEESKNDCSDCQTIFVTFIKDNKIYKTIEDVGNQSTTEFYWAYMPVRFLYQTINLKQIVGDKYKQFAIGYIRFETKGKICDLPKSERFYLITELYNSKEVLHSFQRKYKIKYWGKDEKLKLIYSDGRYYQIEKNNKTVTFDLGYNFLTRNNLYSKFKKKNE